MGQKLLCSVSTIIFLAHVSKVHAVEPLLATELASHCQYFSVQTNNTDSQICTRYIQGFLDGAVATDERVLFNVESQLEKKETYAERAARVRGVGLRDRAAQYAEFCLGDPISLREVVTRVVNDLNSTKLVADALARTVVYTSLRKHYPCK